MNTVYTFIFKAIKDSKKATDRDKFTMLTFLLLLLVNPFPAEGYKQVTDVNWPGLLRLA